MLDRGAERLCGGEDRRAMRHHLGRVEQIAEEVALLAEQFGQSGVAGIVVDLANPWHRSLLSGCEQVFTCWPTSAASFRCSMSAGEWPRNPAKRLRRCARNDSVIAE